MSASGWSLVDALPDDVLATLAGLLDYHTLLPTFARSCRSCRAASAEVTVWIELLRRDYAEPPSDDAAAGTPTPAGALASDTHPPPRRSPEAASPVVD